MNIGLVASEELYLAGRGDDYGRLGTNSKNVPVGTNVQGYARGVGALDQALGLTTNSSKSGIVADLSGGLNMVIKF